jgi:hypothetical protein
VNADQIVTVYTLWGARFDVDGLVARVPIRSKHSVWRRGESEPGMGKASTSGVSITVAEEAPQAVHCRTIERFLTRDARFLRAVLRHRPRLRSELRTMLLVPANGSGPNPFVEFSPRLLSLIAEAGVEWTIATWQGPGTPPSDVAP